MGIDQTQSRLSLRSGGRDVVEMHSPCNLVGGLSLHPGHDMAVTGQGESRIGVERLLVPVILMYPGHVVGGVGLSFMGKCEPAHGYRAKIVQRSST